MSNSVWTKIARFVEILKVFRFSSEQHENGFDRTIVSLFQLPLHISSTEKDTNII